MPGEGGRGAREQVAGVARHCRVHGVGLDGRGTRRSCHRESFLDERAHDALAAVRAPYIEARDRPHGQVIHRLQVPGMQTALMVAEPGNDGVAEPVAAGIVCGVLDSNSSVRPVSCTPFLS